MTNPTSSSGSSVNYWAIVPAAGVGTRMAADRPKQYLPLINKTVVEHSLDRLLNHAMIKGAVIAVSSGDSYWAELDYSHKKTVQLAPGGEERSDSVLNALQVLQQTANKDDWVLVHDAARPCLRADDIDKLILQCKDHPVGGILAVPTKDTIKQTAGPDSSNTVSTTIDRSLLWYAQTPQMFRLGMLRDALTQALAAGVSITDEASALEWAGHTPRLVEGHSDNIKITCPEDLSLAEFFLMRLNGDKQV